MIAQVCGFVPSLPRIVQSPGFGLPFLPAALWLDNSCINAALLHSHSQPQPQGEIQKSQRSSQGQHVAAEGLHQENCSGSSSSTLNILSQLQVQISVL